MLSNWIFVIVMILLAIFAYFIGLTRGVKETEAEHLMDYDKGYADALSYCEQHYQMEEIDPMMNNLYEEQKYEKARKMIKELDELFEDDNGKEEEF